MTVFLAEYTILFIYIFAKLTKLNLKTSRTLVMNINTKAPASVFMKGEPLEFVEKTTYLDSPTRKDRGAQKDRGKTGKSTGRNTEVHYVVNSEYQTEAEITSIKTFHNGCLRSHVAGPPGPHVPPGRQ